MDGDSGVFFPLTYFEKVEGKLIFKNFTVNELKTFSGELTLTKKELQDTKLRLDIRTEERDIATRNLRMVTDAYNIEKDDRIYWQGQHAKAKNGSRFWRTVTVVAIGVGTTLYLTK